MIVIVVVVVVAVTFSRFLRLVFLFFARKQWFLPALCPVSLGSGKKQFLSSNLKQI